jgi:ABC-type siderophore export system fused ATPase/permease subunit
MQSDYIDVHNWRFTPSSFKLVLADLFTMEKIQLKEVSFYDTVGSEFYVSLQLDKSSNTKMTFDRLCLLKKTMLETLESLNELSN